MKINKMCYNYRLTKHIYNEVTNRYDKVEDRLFCTLQEITYIMQDLLTEKEVLYLARTGTKIRTKGKYKGLTITRINPVSIM